MLWLAISVDSKKDCHIDVIQIRLFVRIIVVSIDVLTIWVAWYFIGISTYWPFVNTRVHPLVSTLCCVCRRPMSCDANDVVVSGLSIIDCPSVYFYCLLSYCDVMLMSFFFCQIKELKSTLASVAPYNYTVHCAHTAL